MTSRRAVELFDTTAEGNAVVVADLLAKVGTTASLCTMVKENREVVS